jgi:hypothetical protein
MELLSLTSLIGFTVKFYDNSALFLLFYKNCVSKSVD